MTQERFIEILEAYGADPARWPEAEREAADAYARAHPDLVADALAVEAALDSALGPADAETSALLEARIMKSVPAPAAGRMPAWRIAGAIAAAVLVAVSVGMGTGFMTGSGDDDGFYYDEFAGLDEDWTDWLDEDA